MALESNILGLWAAKQTAKGSPVTFTTGTKRFRWVGGDLQTNRADGSEAWSDGTFFADTVDFVNTLMGNGNPVVQGQSGAIAYLTWLAFGQETVTGGVSAVQTLSVTGGPTGGTFTLTFNGQTTAPIAFNASAANVQAALVALTTIGAGNVTCTGGPLPATPVVITFAGALANTPVVAITHTDSFTGGASPAVGIAQTTAGTLFQHTSTPLDTGGFYVGFVKSVGKSVQHISQYNDCRLQSIRYEGSSASKVVKVTPTFVSLDPGQLLTANPSTTDDGSRPFIYTEAAGTFTVDGQVYRGQSSFAIVVTFGYGEAYGDDVVVYDLTNVEATVTLEAITILLDAQGLARYNQQIYGTATPAANAKPLHTIPANGSYSCTFSKRARAGEPDPGNPTDTFAITVPGVKWDPNLNIPANPAGGGQEMPMAGAMRKVAGQPPITVVTSNSRDAAFSA